MSLSRVKNVVIVALAALCFVQAARVWFGPNMARVVLDALTRPWFGGGNEYGYDELRKPYRFVTSSGIVLDSAEVGAAFANLIGSAPKRAAFSHYGGVDGDLGGLFSGEFVLCEYKTALPSKDFFTDGFSALTARLADFDAVVVKNNEIVFVNYRLAVAARFAVNADDTAGMFGSVGSAVIPCSYMGGVPPVFVPDMEGAVFAAVVPLMPFAEDGDIRRSFVERQAGGYFDNPSRMTSDTLEGVYTFREGNAVVKYYPGHVLEYTNAGYGSGGKSDGFMTAYSAAMAFIKNDKLFGGDCSLSFYERGEGRGKDMAEWRFGFDLSVAGFPVTMTGMLQARAEMEHAVEITVVNGVVAKYRRLAYNFVPDEGVTAAAGRGFAEAYAAANAADAAGSDITSVEVGYSADPVSLENYLTLSWFFATRFPDGESVTTSYPVQ